MVSKDLIAIATLQPPPSPLSSRCLTLPRSTGEGRGLRSAFDAGLMTAGLKKRHQASPRDRGGHGVEKAMIVQKLVRQHNGVEHNQNVAGNVVDCVGRRNCAGSD